MMKAGLRIFWLSTIFFFGVFSTTWAQSGFFREVDEPNGRKNVSGQVKSFRIYKIRVEELRRYLSAPGGEKNTDGLLLEIPMPDGKPQIFRIFESSVLSPEIAARNPQIKTYSGNSVKEPSSKIKITITPEGFNAMILNVHGDAVMFEKTSARGGEVLYKSYSTQDVTPLRNGRGCGALRDKERLVSPVEDRKNRQGKFSNGSLMKEFRLAVAATGEYTANLGAGSSLAAWATVVAYVNEVNAVYESELGVRFVLVSDASIIYSDSLSDPYTAGNQTIMMAENQANLDATIGNAGYDVGHVLDWAGSTSGGGIASTPSVCSDPDKGQGVSGVGDETGFARIFSIQLIAHEIGHQFGMSHSYNSNIPVCTTRELATSVEPGAGATIMSYGFTCGTDDYSDEYDGSGRKTGPFLNFHAVSIQQALNYLATVSCYTTSSVLNNTIPVITAMKTSYIIPRSTPFTLTGSATDGDNNSLSYSWEGTNISTIGDSLNAEGDPVPLSALNPNVIDDDTSPPFFRSYAPVSEGSRTYPVLSAILNGSNKAKGDKLPSVPVVTTHSLTVRDNVGGVATEDVTVTVDRSGPFLVKNDPQGTYQGGGPLVVEWEVNDTHLSPVSCTLVDILLSLDGGNTFSVPLAEAVPNTGLYTAVLPPVNTSQARVKVMPGASSASGNTPNIFFDISNENFVINTEAVFDLALRKTVSADSGKVYRAGDEVVFRMTVFNQGTVDATHIEIVDYIPAGLTLTDSNWTLSGSKAYLKAPIPGLSAGAEATAEIRFTVNSDAVGRVSNFAEISRAEGGTDIDSVADDDPGNDGIPKNDEIHENGKKGGDEDDHDLQVIKVCQTGKCLGVKTQRVK